MVSLTPGPAASGPEPVGTENLLDRLATWPRPAVVQYWSAPRQQGLDDDVAEPRVELSGRVLVNWAAKTANLLDVEGMISGSRVLVDLPTGWKSLAVALGALWTGAEVVAVAPASSPSATSPAPPDASLSLSGDAVLTDDPERWAEHPGLLVAISAGTTDTEFPEDLPAHAVDFSAEVRAQADQFMLPSPDLSPEALMALVCQAQGAELDDDWIGEQPPSPWFQPGEAGLAVAAAGHRLTAPLLFAAVAAWERLQPVVLVEADRLDDLGQAALRALQDGGLR